MNRLCTLVLVVEWIAGGSSAMSQSPVYFPLGEVVVSPYAGAPTKPESTTVRRINLEARPVLPGLRSIRLELVEDALVRKMPHKLQGSTQAAREYLAQMSKTRSGLNRLNGVIAEAQFLDSNPEWGYVRAPNAHQHDVYRWVMGRRPPFTGQIKFYESFDAERYARAMELDHRAHRFFIPNDHVEPLKEFLTASAQQMEHAGEKPVAAQLWRDYARVRPIGKASGELLAIRDNVIAEARAEQTATYISLGAAVGVAAAPLVSEWARGEMPRSEVLHHVGRSSSILAAGYGADVWLGSLRSGSLRGTLAGNAIVGAALVAMDTAWLIQKYNGFRALHQPEFYTEFSGTVGAASLGLAGAEFTAGATAECGPWVAVPATLAVGTVLRRRRKCGRPLPASQALRGHRATLVQRQQLSAFDCVRQGIDWRLEQAKRLPLL